MFQDNRLAGGSVRIRIFRVSDFGKLYRSCGDCEAQAARTVTIQNLFNGNDTGEEPTKAGAGD